MLKFENKTLIYKEKDIEFRWTPIAEIAGERLGIDQMKVISKTDDAVTYRCHDGLEWSFTKRIDNEQVFLDSQLTNQTGTPVRLGRFFILDVQRPFAFGAPARKPVGLMQSGSQGRCNAYRLDNADAAHESKIYLQLYANHPDQAFQVGFQTFTRIHTFVEYDYDENEGINGLRAVCDFDGFALSPGKSVSTEQLVLRIGDDPLAQMTAWAECAAAIYKPVIPEDSPLGLCGFGAWVDTFNSAANYETINLEMIDAINQRLAGFGFAYCWISIGNLPGGIPGEWLGWNFGNFSHGPEEFNDELAIRGWKFGLWCGPFYISSSQKDMMNDFSDALLKTSDGELLIVKRAWSHGDAGKLPPDKRPELYSLDPTHPKSLKFIKKVFETYQDWGVKYFMLDFLDAGAGKISYYPYQSTCDQTKIPGPEAYRVFLKTIRKAIGANTYLLGCTGPTWHNVGILDGVRTGTDFGEGRPLNPESFFYPASFVVNNISFSSGVRAALNNQAAHFHAHRRLFINDSGNLLTVDSPIPLEHARIHAVIHCMSGAQTMIGDDIRQISEERLRLIKVTLPRPKEVAVPVDLFDSPMPIGPQIFHRKIQKQWGRHDVVAVYNLSSEATKILIPPEKLGLQKDWKYLVWEFFDQRLVGKKQGDFTVELPAESVRVFRLMELPAHPAMLATDTHITMGEVDIIEQSYDETTNRLYIKATRPAGDEQGGIYVYAPDDVYVKNPEGIHIAKDARDNSLIIYIPLKFDQDGFAEREIFFGDLKTG